MILCWDAKFFLDNSMAKKRARERKETFSEYTILLCHERYEKVLRSCKQRKVSTNKNLMQEEDFLHFSFYIPRLLLFVVDQWVTT